MMKTGDRWFPSILLVLLAGALAGCAEGTFEGLDPRDEGSTITLEVETPGSADGSAATSSGGPSIGARISDTDASGNELVADTLLLVLDQIEYKRASTEDCTDSGLPDDGDGCSEVVVQPSVLFLEPGVGLQSNPIIEVPTGTYDRIEFDLHVLQPGAARDSDILTDFDKLEFGVSLRLDGSFNGESYDYFSELGTEVEVDLQEPLVIQAQDDGVITLEIDVLSWFLRNDGTFIDPRTASSSGSSDNPNLDPDARETVRTNILQSFRATGRISG